MSNQLLVHKLLLWLLLGFLCSFILTSPLFAWVFNQVPFGAGGLMVLNT
jgi:hypothetical protein